MKQEIYGHSWPVSTRRFSAAKYGRCAAFSTVNLNSDPVRVASAKTKSPRRKPGDSRPESHPVCHA